MDDVIKSAFIHGKRKVYNFADLSLLLEVGPRVVRNENGIKLKETDEKVQ